MKTPARPGLAIQWPGASWSFVALLAFLLNCAGPSAQASPLNGPQRIVNGRTVDLTPLFHWWTNHHGERPLSAWVHVTGTIGGTNASGWVISGQAGKSKARARELGGESSAGAGIHQFVLKNPPAQEAADFARLRGELKQANEERGRLQSEAADAKTQEALLQKSTRGRARANATAPLRRVEQADNELVKSLDQKIKLLKKNLAAYPNPDHYQIDAIALDTGTEYNHAPVYDHGAVLK